MLSWLHLQQTIVRSDFGLLFCQCDADKELGHDFSVSTSTVQVRPLKAIRS